MTIVLDVVLHRDGPVDVLAHEASSFEPHIKTFTSELYAGASN